LGSRILRTDQHGAITVITDGENIEVKTFLKGEFQKEMILSTQSQVPASVP
jgi:hypothetical protein